MSKRTYTTAEAAVALGVTVGRVRQMVLEGLIKAERFGRALAIPEAEITKARNRKTRPGPLGGARKPTVKKGSGQKKSEQ